MSQVQTVMRGGSRFYVNPDEPLVTVPGVTSVIGMLAKPFLQFWSAKMAAELAVDSIDYLKEMAERDRDGAVSFVKGAAQRYTKTRAEIGSQAHDLFERMIRGEYIGRVPPDLEPYRRHFAEFIATVNPTLISAEDVMWSDQHAYAGSSDAILAVRLNERNEPDPNGEPVTLLCDWKTSKDIHAEVALQLSAYANADRLVRPDGGSEPMVNVEGGAVLHITPDGWTFRPVEIGPDVFETFLALRRVFEWDREISKRVIGKPIAKSQSSKLVTGTQRRAK
jgi:hypothetical protein